MLDFIKELCRYIKLRRLAASRCAAPRVQISRDLFEQHIESIVENFTPGSRVEFNVQDDAEGDRPEVGYCVAASELGVVIADGLSFVDIAEARTYPIYYIRMGTVKQSDDQKVKLSMENGSVLPEEPGPLKFEVRQFHLHQGDKIDVPVSRQAYTG